MVRRLRRILHRSDTSTERGQTLVEFSMILPLMLVLLFALVDFGRGFHTWLVVTNAAREGARVAATQKDYATIQTRIYDSLGSLDPADLDIDPTNVQGARGEAVEIDLTYEFEYVTPIGGIINFMTGGSLDTPVISSHASMRLE
jgi:Flp pilus assembly protein TadG